MSNRIGSRLPIIVLILVAGAAYGPLLGHEILDLDYDCWIRVASPPSSATLRAVWTPNPEYWHGTGYFAPLTATSMMFDVWVGAMTGNPAAVHFSVNPALHLLNGLLVFVLLRRLQFEDIVAFAATAVFLLHPLQVSSVAWVAERKNLLTAFFFLSAFILYVRYRQRGNVLNYLGAICAYGLSLFAKPSAVALAPCLFATDLLLIDRRFTGISILRMVPLVALGGIWVEIASVTEIAAADPGSLLERFLTAAHSMVFLLEKFFVPVALSLIYPPVEVDPASLSAWLPVVVLLVIASATCAAIVRARGFAVAWGLSVWAINLIPSLGLVPFAGMKQLYVADHYHYMATVGLSVAAAAVAVRGVRWLVPKRGEALAAGVTASALVVLVVLCCMELSVWRSGESVWNNVLRHHPESFEAHFNLGSYLHERGRSHRAAQHYARALEIDPDNPHARKLLYNRALIELSRGKLKDARTLLYKAVDLHTVPFPHAHALLARLHARLGEYGLALEHCRYAASLCDEAILWERVRRTVSGSPVETRTETGIGWQNPAGMESRPRSTEFTVPRK